MKLLILFKLIINSFKYLINKLLSNMLQMCQIFKLIFQTFKIIPTNFHSTQMKSEKINFSNIPIFFIIWKVLNLVRLEKAFSWLMKNAQNKKKNLKYRKLNFLTL